MPYLPYAREDRAPDTNTGFALKAFCNQLKTMEFERIEVFDPHSEVAFSILDNLYKMPMSNFYDSHRDDEQRSNPDLIEVIERLGEKANGTCARLAIEDIPDNSRYEIEEYDGMESVVPPRMSW